MAPQPSAAPDQAETGRSERRRQAIIKAATDVFVRHGYLGATTDEVAARASVSKQTLYKHFTDKQHLFAEVIGDATVQVVDGLSNAVASTLDDAPDVRQGLRATFHTLLHRCCQRKSLRVVSLGQRLRRFADHITTTVGEEHGERVRRWFHDKKAGWSAQSDDGRGLGCMTSMLRSWHISAPSPALVTSTWAPHSSHV